MSFGINPSTNLNKNNNLPALLPLKNSDEIERLNSIFCESVKKHENNKKNKSFDAINQTVTTKINSLKQVGIKTVKDFLDTNNSKVFNNAGISDSLVKVIKEQVKKELYENSQKSIHDQDKTNPPTKPVAELSKIRLASKPTRENAAIVSYDSKKNTYNFFTNNVTLSKTKENQEKYIVSFIGNDQESIDFIVGELSNFDIKEEPNILLSEYPTSIGNDHSSSTFLWRFNRGINTKREVSITSEDDSDDNTDLDVFDRVSYLRAGILLPNNPLESKKDYIPYLMSDVVCFVTTESLTSIRFRDSLFEWMRSFSTKSRSSTMPKLIIISFSQSNNIYIDQPNILTSKMATREFFSILDHRAETLLFFEDVRAIRVPSKTNDSLNKLFSNQMSDLSKLIETAIASKAELRRSTMVSISEKVSYLFLQHLIGHEIDNDKEIKMDKIIHFALQPSNKISDHITYQFKSLILHDSDHYHINQRYSFAKQFAVKQIIRYFLHQLDESISLEDLSKAKEKSEIYKAVTQLVLLNVEKLKNIFTIMEPCQATIPIKAHSHSLIPATLPIKPFSLIKEPAFLEKEILTCRIIKAYHACKSSGISLHFPDIKSDFTKDPKVGKIGFFAWTKIKQNTLFYKPWQGDFVPLNDNTINEATVHTIFEDVLLRINNSQKKPKLLPIIEEDVRMIRSILKKDFASTRLHPSIPCFVCFKTEDKTPLSKIDDSIFLHEPILLKNMPFVCCDECASTICTDSSLQTHENTEILLNIPKDNSNKQEI